MRPKRSNGNGGTARNKLSIKTRTGPLTPRRAAQLLQTQSEHSNRKLNIRYAQRLKDAIVNGEWADNAETIKIDENGVLLDGQHRCQAVVLAQQSIPVSFSTNVPRKTFPTIDQSPRRKASDAFGMQGEKNSTLLSASVSWLWKYKRGHLFNGHQASPRITQSQETLNEHPNIRNSMKIAQSAKKFMSPSMVGCLHYLFSRKNQDDADRFFDALITGDSISRTSPSTSGIYWLRKRLQDDSDAKAKLVNLEKFKLTIKAWNSMREGVVVKNLNHKNGEKFPAII